MSRLPTISRVQALRGLHGAGEVLLFLRVWCFAVTVPLLMRLPLPRLAALLRRDAPSATESPHPGTAERLNELVALAQRVGHPLVRGGCLTRSVTLYWFLTGAGFDVELRFGLGDLEQRFTGHCWLALEGEPFLERVDPRPRFTELYRVPAARGT